jgi:hydroxymethylbilane synthase
MEERIRERLSPEISLPAIGQGAIGIECRRDDARVNNLIQPLHDRETSLRVMAERAMNAKLNGGCQVPIAGFAEISHDALMLRGLVGEPDGSNIIRAEIAGPVDNAEEMGQVLAEDLLARGAGKILEALYAEG